MKPTTQADSNAPATSAARSATVSPAAAAQRQTVLSFVDAINAHDVDGIVGLLSADYEFVNSSGDRFHQGRQFFRDEWSSQFAKHPDFRIRVGKVIADEGGVALFGYSEGTYAPDGELKPENKWSVPAAFMAMARDGKITYFETFSDASMVYDLIQSRNAEK